MPYIFVACEGILTGVDVNFIILARDAVLADAEVSLTNIIGNESKRAAFLRVHCLVSSQRAYRGRT